MSAAFKQRGDSIDFTPAADVSAGDVIVQGDMVGVAKLDIPAGKLGALALTGVYAATKATGAGSAIPAGTKLYFDAAAKVVTANAAGGANKYFGKSTKDAGDTDTTVEARLAQ